jgi:4a-hydroxytetrahydrobiopterin dehydratase
MRLSDDEIRAQVPDGWAHEGDVLRREFTFKGFGAAVAFVDRLVAPANEARHHPDLEIHYNRVVVSLSTHDQGGVTDLDIAMARTVDDLVET